MRKTFFKCSIAALLSAEFCVSGAQALARAAPSAPSAAETSTLRTFDIATEKGFTHYRAATIAWLSNQKMRDVAHVCLLGERDVDGSEWVWAIWREGRKLILWDGGDTTFAMSRRLLDERRDVVASEADVHGSTYLVTRAWVSDLKARCASSGTQLVVSPSELLTHHAHH